MNLSKWWKGVAWTGLGLEAFILVVGANAYSFFMVLIGVLLIGAVLPPWLDSVRLFFSSDISMSERLWLWVVPWGLGTGFSALTLGASLTLVGPLIAVGIFLSSMGWI